MGPIGRSIDPSLAEKLGSADRKLNDLLPDIDKAERCGIDVSQIRETHNLMRTTVDSLRREYFG